MLTEARAAVELADGSTPIWKKKDDYSNRASHLGKLTFNRILASNCEGSD